MSASARRTPPRSSAGYSADQGPERGAHLGDDAGPVAVADQVDGDPVDPRAEHPLVQLLGDLLRRTEEGPVAAVLGDGLAELLDLLLRLADQAHAQVAGRQRRGVPADLLAALPQHGDLARQLRDVAD